MSGCLEMTHAMCESRFVSFIPPVSGARCLCFTTEGIHQMTIKTLALAVQQNYAAGMSGADDAQFQALVDLGDQAHEIIRMEDELAANRETLRRVWALAQQMYKSLGWIESHVRGHSEWWGSEDTDTVENEWLRNTRDLLKLLEDVPKTSPEASAAHHRDPLSLFSETELFSELSKRGAVVSSWSDGDLSFLDDEAPEEVSDDELPALKSRVIELAKRGLEETLGSRGNEYLADWWSMHSDDALRAHEESLAEACVSYGVDLVGTAKPAVYTWRHKASMRSSTGMSFKSRAEAARDAIRTLKIKV